MKVCPLHGHAVSNWRSVQLWGICCPIDGLSTLGACAVHLEAVRLWKHRNAFLLDRHKNWLTNNRETETHISMPEMITGKRKRRSARQIPDDIGKWKKKTEKRKMEQEQKRKRKEENGKKKRKPDTKIIWSCRKIFCVIMPEISAVFLWSCHNFCRAAAVATIAENFPMCVYMYDRKNRKRGAHTRRKAFLGKNELAVTNYR